MHMKKTLRFVSLILVTVMLFSLTACMGRNEKYAVEVDGKQIPIGVYLYYQFNAYQEAYSLRADTNTDVLKQKIEDQDATVWIHQKTIEYCRKKIATENEFERLGMTLSDNDLAYIDSMVTYILAYYSDIFAKNGIGEQSVRTACTTDQMTSALFYKYYGADGLEPVSDTELMNYYKDNYSVAYMFGTSLSGLSEEEVKTARDAANTAVESLKAGKGIAETAQAMTKAIDPSAELDSTVTDDSYRSIIGKNDTNYPETIRNQIFAAAADVPTIYDQDNYLLVFVRKDTASQTEVYESLKNTILQAIKGDEFSDRLKEMANALTVNENTAAVNYYSPKKIKNFD